MDQELKNMLRTLLEKMSRNEAKEEEDRRRQAQGQRGRTDLERLTPGFSGDEIATANQLAQLESRRKEILDAIGQARKEDVAAIEASLNYGTRQAQQAKIELDTVRQIKRLEEDRVNILRDQLEKIKDKFGEQSTEANVAERSLNAAQQELGVAEQNLKVQRERTNEATRYAGQLDYVEQRAAAAITTITRGLFVTRASERSFIGAIFGGGGGASFTQKLKAIGAAFGGANFFLNAFVGTASTLVNTFARMAMQQDSAAESFRRATGAGTEYNTIINETVRRTSNYAVTFDESAQAASVFFNRMSQFTQLLPGTAQRVLEFAQVQERLGTSFETSSRTMNIMTKAFGFGAEQAMDFQRRINAFARTISVNEEEALNNFIQFAGALSAHGPRMESVFKNLQLQAKNTGLAMADLVSVARQFDTFEGAANAVGKLNALLGGNYFNSVRMVNAAEDERVRILARGIEQSRMNIQTMGRFQKMALAQAMGIQDVSKAMMLLGNELGTLDSKQRKRLEMMRTDEEQAKSMISIQRQLRSIFIAVANSLMPVINNLMENKDQIVANIQGVVEWIKQNGELILKLQVIGPVASLAAHSFIQFAKAVGAARLASAGLLGILTGGLIAAGFQLNDIFSKPHSRTMTQAFNDNANATNNMANSFRNARSAVGDLRDEGAGLANVVRSLGAGFESMDPDKISRSANALKAAKDSLSGTDADTARTAANSRSIINVNSSLMQAASQPQSRQLLSQVEQVIEAKGGASSAAAGQASVANVMPMVMNALQDLLKGKIVERLDVGVDVDGTRLASVSKVINQKEARRSVKTYQRG